MQTNQSRAQDQPNCVLSWAVTLTLAISLNHPRYGRAAPGPQNQLKLLQLTNPKPDHPASLTSSCRKCSPPRTAMGTQHL